MTREEAINKVRWVLVGLVVDKDIRDAFEMLIPELRESEDERIRKKCIELIKRVIPSGDSHSQESKEILDCIAYLEKQKKKKFDFELIKQAWYMEGYKDREFGKESKWIIKTGEGGPEYELNPKYGQPLALTEEQKPAEWSEEDETRLTNILIMLKEYAIHHYSKDDVNKSVNWLENRFKSLRPSWKPSEQEKRALLNPSTNSSKSYKPQGAEAVPST